MKKNNSGFLRHIVIRRGYHTHEMMVVLVTRKEHFFQGEKKLRRLFKKNCQKLFLSYKILIQSKQTSS